MTVHFHVKDRSITVHSGERGFSNGLGFRIVQQCERCGFATNEYYELEGAYMCDNCYTEVVELVDKAYSVAFSL